MRSLWSLTTKGEEKTGLKKNKGKKTFPIVDFVKKEGGGLREGGGFPRSKTKLNKIKKQDSPHESPRKTGSPSPPGKVGFF